MSHFDQITPAVVILDLHLPNEAGTDILNKICAQTHLKGVQGVVVSADARLAEQTDGPADFVLMPDWVQLAADLASRLLGSQAQTKDPV